MSKNPFDLYSSKIKKVNIPLPSFYHAPKAMLEDTLAGNIISRDRMVEKLKAWLSNEDTDNGSFLVTGYRGMGKTSFVNKVLRELVERVSYEVNVIGIILFAAFTFCLYELLECLKSSYWYDPESHTLGFSYDYKSLLYFFICVFISSSILIIYRHNEIQCTWKKTAFWVKAVLHYLIYNCEDKTNADKIKECLSWRIRPKEWDRISNTLYGNNCNDRKYSNVAININLGQEILDEREVLCVLTSQLYDKYKSYILSPIANHSMWFVWATSVAVLCTWFPISANTITINIFGLIKIAYTEWYNVPLWTCTILLLLWHHIRTIRKLNVLHKQLDAEMRTANGLSIPIGDATVNTEESFFYPLASTRNIESQLITILDKIKSFPFHPTFYFIFDELDKLESRESGSASTLEYNREKYQPGGGVSKKRQKTVLHLLANLKFFTSTAKAKFVFIAGRELYDGYLADMADRESAVSSIFTGVIYIESFCKNEKSDKDVMYNTETFLVRLLLPKQHIEKKIIESFIQCKKDDKMFEHIDIDLKMYYEYLICAYADNYLSEEDQDKGRNVAFKEARTLIDYVINLLYHYSIYLYHISNGSPKKIKQNIESHIRPLRDPEEFLLTKESYKRDHIERDIDLPLKCSHMLSFDELQQRIIGFINYITFPVNQIVTDATQYGDKLLVSASYLINHIYKHHSAGFSWRNIEQTPELLEVYKIPEFRDFIESILSYLKQTHITNISYGLYQYKFRKHIAEEISMASKISEEVSALFNFSRDESNAIKKYYRNIQVNHNEELKDEQVSSRHSGAGLHQIMGDLYMADEDYNNAIIAYQTALSIINRKKEGEEKGIESSHLLPYMRNMLKLGNAYEKRHSLSQAYSAYNTLSCQIIEVVSKFDYSFASRAYQPIENNISALNSLLPLEQAKLSFLPILAKLYAVEKMDTNGIVESDIDAIQTEFENLRDKIHFDDKYLLVSDFYLKLGDILYYKNSDLLSGEYGDPKRLYIRSLKNMFDHVTIDGHTALPIGDDLLSIPLEILGSIGSTILIQDIKSIRRESLSHIAESLECLGNVALSQASFCSFEETIMCSFMADFLHDVHLMNKNIDNIADIHTDEYRLPIHKESYKKDYLLTSVLYYWEAFIFFKLSSEQKKASDSLKKILRIFQNYLRINEGRRCCKDKYNERKIVIGEFLNEIKNRIIKQCLISLFSHYRYVNMGEIQQLKWVFYVNMYEHISLNRLSLFPDVEEIMLIYYEMIRLCVVDNIADKDESLGNKVRKIIIESIEQSKKESIAFAWNSLTDRNIHFNRILVGIYTNLALSGMRQDCTSYERILTLRFKTEMNSYILNLMFYSKISSEQNVDIQYQEILNSAIPSQKNADISIDSLRKEDKSETWKNEFIDLFVHAVKSAKDKHSQIQINEKKELLEFLITDSIYCLTTILNSITPYTSTTLFTHSFMAGVYRDLRFWNILFDNLLIRYKQNYSKSNNYMDDVTEKRELKFKNFDSYMQEQRERCTQNCIYYESVGENDLSPEGKIASWNNRCPYYMRFDCDVKNKFHDNQITHNLETPKEFTAFFAKVLSTIGKTNNQYLIVNYSTEMTIDSFRKAKEVHCQGQAYKNLISKMFFLDDDFNNDTVQFDMAIERFKINSGHIDQEIKHLTCSSNNSSLFDIENFCIDNENSIDLHKRFID